jgi:hypothetical protein
MKNLNMWYNEELEKYALAALTGMVAKEELYNPYDLARKVFDIAQAMIVVKEEYTKKD